MNSSIMFNLDELNLVSNQIEKNMNKKVNYLKQLYKGTKMLSHLEIMMLKTAFNI